MHTLKINRKITEIETVVDKISFLLNDIPVYINYATNYMHTRPKSSSTKSIFWQDNVILIEFVTAILNGGLTGSVKLDTTNKDMVDFLKLTKCLP